MCPLKHCCFCINLRYGVLIIAGIDLVWGSYWLINGALICVSYTYLEAGMLGYERMFYGLSQVILSAALFAGMLMEELLVVMVYLILNIFIHLIMVTTGLAALLFSSYYPYSKYLGPLEKKLIAGFIFLETVVDIYCFAVVLSYYMNPYDEDETFCTPLRILPQRHTNLTSYPYPGTNNTYPNVAAYPYPRLQPGSYPPPPLYSVPGRYPQPPGYVARGTYPQS